jgi:hypothetical protein
LVLVVVLLVIAIKKGRTSQPRAEVEESAAARARALEALRAQDPAFDEAALSDRALRMMSAINDAWTRGELAPIRRFVSDGVYVRFSAQLHMMRHQGKRNAMADARALSATIVSAEASAQWDTVHVKMVAEARDVDCSAKLSTQEAIALAKKAPVHPYQEVWSFLRRRGAKSKAGVPALEGACANCGAPLPSAEVVRCDVCKALTNSGEHDWVLAEITQPEEFSPTVSAEQEALLDPLRQRDPGVSRQELEDRASVVFWKWLEARVTDSRAGLERFCRTPGKPQAPHGDLRLVAVGSADVLQVTQDAAEKVERVTVQMVWSAANGGKPPEPRRHRVVLVRSNEALSRRGLSCLDCPHCGGPVAESDAVTCRYCREPLAAGGKEWALDTILAG